MAIDRSIAPSALGIVPPQTGIASEAHLPWYRHWLNYAREARLRHRSRRELLFLDDRSLADIGLTRCDAMREAGKPFWQA